ncbi:hypothetical protein BJ170DRAFT_388606 [Xylariales sp. AK1849]|nr:hypothetical protein BJ170DRAFT_388606 [Xylariales sp. AK1849]
MVIRDLARQPHSHGGDPINLEGGSSEATTSGEHSRAENQYYQQIESQHISVPNHDVDTVVDETGLVNSEEPGCRDVFVTSQRATSLVLAGSHRTAAQESPAQQEAIQDVDLAKGDGQLNLTTILEQSSVQTYAFSVCGRLTSCTRNCLCSCHSRGASAMRFSLPPFLRHISGSLFVGYTGYPLTSTRCDRHSCLKKRQTQIEIAYLFPSWFLQGALRVLIARSFGSITVSLKVYRTLPWESGSIFQCAQQGNVTLLKQRIEEDPTSVNALCDSDGAAPLYHALAFTQIDVARALLQAGADPYLEGGRPHALALATQMVLVGQLSPEVCRALTELLPVSNYTKELELSFLHKVVVGLCPVGLEPILQGCDSLILEQLDVGDGKGWTPLHWATARNDISSIQKLLKSWC